MILRKPTLSVRRLEVFKAGREVYAQAFHTGVNIIRGVGNSTGKSTIADFILFALGGDVTKWKPEAASCDTVIAEVWINGVPITLRRRISPQRSQPMDIFWGSLDDAQKSAVQGWQSYPFKRTSLKESFSQALFRALTLPEARSDADSNITIHQVLRLMFVDQMSPPDALFTPEQFDSPITRQTVFDLLLGLFDDGLYADEQALRLARQRQEATKERIEALRGAIADLEQEVDATVLEREIKERQAQLLRIAQTLERLAKLPASTAAPGADDSAELQKVFESLRRERLVLTDRIARLEVDIQDSDQFIRELSSRAQALAESIAVRGVLGGLAINVCPQCLQPLKEGHPEHTCRLCGQDVAKGDAGAGQTLRLQQELALQIRESTALLDERRVELQEALGQLPGVRRAADQAGKRLRERLSSVTSERNQELDELYQKKGNLESEVQYLVRFHKAALTFSRLREAAANLAAEVARLELSVETKRRAQRDRRVIAENRISERAVQLLRLDLPSEEHFEAAQHVSVNVGANSFAVDGRNQFSASSVTFLKSAVHFALLFSSLELGFFRYPRLLISDNIEDKGMVPGRSQNLQRLLVEWSSKSDVEHQIIFTTSMIAPDLNTPQYCVGEEYTHDKKSLKV